jgi:hypothetical protein
MAKVQREDALLKSAEQAFVATLGFLAGALLLHSHLFVRVSVHRHVGAGFCACCPEMLLS